MDYAKIVLYNCNGDNQTLVFVKEQILSATYLSDMLKLEIFPSAKKSNNKFSKYQQTSKVDINYYSKTKIEELKNNDKNKLSILRDKINTKLKINSRTEDTLNKKLISLSRLSSEFTSVSEQASDLENLDDYWFIKSDDRESLIKELIKMNVEIHDENGNIVNPFLV